MSKVIVTCTVGKPLSYAYRDFSNRAKHYRKRAVGHRFFLLYLAKRAVTDARYHYTKVKIASNIAYYSVSWYTLGSDD